MNSEPGTTGMLLTSCASATETRSVLKVKFLF
jgi:hypothetical protein